MIKNIIFITTIFFFIINNSHAKTELYIYATVNNQIITNYDVKKEALYLKILNPGLAQISEDKIFQLSKESLINEIIKLNEIKKIFNIKDENSFVKDYLKQMYTKLNFNSELEFERSLLASKNYSLNEIKQKLKIEILWNELIYLKYNNQIKIDKEKIKTKIKNQKKILKEYNLSEILFQLNSDEKLSDKYELILKNIKNSGFKNSANIFSISDSSKFGGEIGWVNENQLNDRLVEEVENLNIDQLTQPIQTSSGYLIIKLNKKRQKETKLDFDKTFKQMITEEKNRQLNQFSLIYFNKIKQNIFISEK